MATKKQPAKKDLLATAGIHNETNPRDLGMLALMAIGLASDTAEELKRTGKVANLKIARTRLKLLIGSAEAILKHLRQQKDRV